MIARMFKHKPEIYHVCTQALGGHDIVLLALIDEAEAASENMRSLPYQLLVQPFIGSKSKRYPWNRRIRPIFPHNGDLTTNRCQESMLNMFEPEDIKLPVFRDQTSRIQISVGACMVLLPRPITLGCLKFWGNRWHVLNR